MPALDAETDDEPGKERAEGDSPGVVPGLVRTFLPEVGHDALRAGITGVVRFAAEQQRVLDAVLSRLDAAITGVVPREPRPEPGDELLEVAVNGVGLTDRGTFSRYSRYYSSDHNLYGLPRRLGRSMRNPAEPALPGRIHVELARQKPLEQLDALALPELPAILALRAGSACTVEEHREALAAALPRSGGPVRGIRAVPPPRLRAVRTGADAGARLGGSVPRRTRRTRPRPLVPVGRRGVRAAHRCHPDHGPAGGRGPAQDRRQARGCALRDEMSEPVPSFRPALLDAVETDSHLTALFAEGGPDAQETALRLAHDRLFAELLADPGDPVAGERDADGLRWPQDPTRSVPDLVGEVTQRYGLGEDAAVLYLMLLAMPDPTDRNTARWTGWGKQRGGTARLRAARAELAATDLVVEGSRSKAGRSLFLPGGWTQLGKPHLPLERWKLSMYDLLDGESAVLGVVVPTRPVAGLYREAWRRTQDGDGPQLEELEVPPPRNRRR